MKQYPLWLWLLLTLLVCACKPDTTELIDCYTMDKKTSEDFLLVSQARIFFGHQSVGNNIITGIKEMQEKTDNHRIRLIELGDEAKYPQSFLLQSKIGKNTDPKSKCDDFRRIIDQQLAGKIDYALLKFCYIDIDEHSDVEAIFAHYKETLDTLKARNPDITFIHVTSPLRHSPTNFGVWIREILGRRNRSKLANIKRNEFNELLRFTYSGDPIFDLAASESTYPDGRRESFQKDGKTYHSLIGLYTDDGGHLNQTGQLKVAADFLHSIAAAIRAH